MDIQGFNPVDYSNKPSSGVHSAIQSGQQSGLAQAKMTASADELSKNTPVANAEIDSQQVDKLLTNVNEKVKALQSFLKFEKDEDTEKMVFSIKNSETGEVIRQIPSKDLLEVSKQISQYLDKIQQSPGDRPGSPVGLLTDQIV
ncbi:MAG: flagellar protein FlaG [Thiomicrospira sp.]|nr:flagellar protein FlaG [Thiomicrospira sp.]NCO15088.1 flagellar protein FlaG [Thiomicrospira sp.]